MSGNVDWCRQYGNGRGESVKLFLTPKANVKGGMANVEGMKIDTT